MYEYAISSTHRLPIHLRRPWAPWVTNRKDCVISRKSGVVLFGQSLPSLPPSDSRDEFGFGPLGLGVEVPRE